MNTVHRERSYTPRYSTHHNVEKWTLNSANKYTISINTTRRMKWYNNIDSLKAVSKILFLSQQRSIETLSLPTDIETFDFHETDSDVIIRIIFSSFSCKNIHNSKKKIFTLKTANR